MGENLGAISAGAYCTQCGGWHAIDTTAALCPVRFVSSTTTIPSARIIPVPPAVPALPSAPPHVGPEGASLEVSPLGALALARRFHEAYERLAPQYGYTTRPESAVPWERVPESNRRLMVAVCAEMLSALAPAASSGGAPAGETTAARVLRRIMDELQWNGRNAAGETLARIRAHIADYVSAPAPTSDAREEVEHE